MLTLRDIRKSYRIGPTEVDVLKGVSLEIQQGELVSIMGQSGCGKSTLMNIIGLLDRPTSGSFMLDGAEVSYSDDDALSEIRNQRIGFVFQQYFLLSRLTALENVALPLVYRGDTGTNSHDRCMELLKRVGMDDRANHRPNELSGGQQQRVAIARALVGNPSLILADEPTGALDTNVGGEIMELFKTLNAEEGITVVIITHDPGIARQCKRVAVMKDGVIVP
ncbi:putative ABC transport system ATP-binding protein [Trichlorobacter thiogenes]|uniref:Putative ABC transport system ATP-binding protein n=1 Tax=Trichlorobacter thiogenes TaxID=115783 RepID=A0A1T4Q3X5_9BACT|nr:ABC transporter ATP-binding protein [Trichlorobacter thiogenes]SJZ98449.1 putative ABC transport system ATP-binding protein [Trichlorobacter thiogenes]